jgi:hypothetical protein
MLRRFMLPLAAGVVGLVAISPVFAAETYGKGSPAPPPGQPAGPGPGSGGGSGGGGGSSSSTCAPPQTDQGPAPQVGEPPQNHGAGDAGNVDVERLSPTELRIAKATPKDGWTQQVTAPSGPRVTVKFSHPGGSPSVIRFAASMDQAGRVIHTRVQSCG